MVQKLTKVINLPVFGLPMYAWTGEEASWCVFSAISLRFEEQFEDCTIGDKYDTTFYLFELQILSLYFPSLLTPVLFCNFFNQDKRKASMDNLMQQPPLKKLASDGSIGSMSMNSMQGAVAAGFSTGIGVSPTMSSISRQLSNEQLSGRELGGQTRKASSVLALAWKEDMDAGQFLLSLSHFFGDSVFSFVPKPEMSIFLWFSPGRWDSLWSRVYKTSVVLILFPTFYFSYGDHEGL